MILGTTSAASTPRMTITTMISIRVKPRARRWPCGRAVAGVRAEEKLANLRIVCLALSGWTFRAWRAGTAGYGQKV
ncbi:hypothetical protein D3C71_2009600 [compost metagenome]